MATAKFKISDLTDITSNGGTIDASNDYLIINDATGPETKKVSVSNLIESGIQSGGQNIAFVIDSNTTFYVATTGNDATGDGTQSSPWATLQKAADHLSQRRLKTGVTVTVSIGAGTYTSSSPLNLDHPQGTQITYQGVVSGTQPTGDNLNGNSGGTAVRGNTAGALSANDTLLTGYFDTVLQFNGSTGIEVSSDASVNLSQLLIRGNGVKAVSGRPNDGLRVQGDRGVAGGGGYVALYNVAIHNFGDRGMALVSGGTASTLESTITNCDIGIGITSGVLLGDSLSLIPVLTVSNCNRDGLAVGRNGVGVVKDCLFSNNGGVGALVQTNSTVRLSSSIINNNGKEGVSVRELSSAILRSAQIKDNGRTDVHASVISTIDFSRDPIDAGTISPPVGTVGNDGSLIRGQLS